jgi:hypothetical protein
MTTDCPQCAARQTELADVTGAYEVQLIELRLENLRLQQENEALIEQLDVELQSRNKEKWYE